MIASMTQAYAEAVALIRKAGIPAQTFVDAMTSTIFNVPIYKNYGGLIASEQFSPWFLNDQLPTLPTNGPG